VIEEAAKLSPRKPGEALDDSIGAHVAVESVGGSHKVAKSFHLAQ